MIQKAEQHLQTQHERDDDDDSSLESKAASTASASSNRSESKKKKHWSGLQVNLMHKPKDATNDMFEDMKDWIILDNGSVTN